MSSNKSEETKKRLKTAQSESKRAPVWVFPRTGRKVRRSPKTGRSWRHDSIFDS